MFSAFTSGAQSILQLDRFDALQKDESVYLDWILSSGSVCFGLSIQRSTDSINFETVGQIPGICGSLNTPVQYQYLDQTPPLNQKLYYRLSYNGLGQSHIVSLLVHSFAGDKYKIYPQPVVTTSTLIFSNPKSESCTLEVYNIEGKIVATEQSSSNEFQINAEDWNSGLYQFLIRDPQSKNLIRGKFLVN